MKAIVFAICLTVGLTGVTMNVSAQQDAKQGAAMSAKKNKVSKVGTESNEVISASPMAARKKRDTQRPAINTIPATSGSVMSAGKGARDSK